MKCKIRFHGVNHLLFLPWRKKVSKKGQDCARFTRKTSVQKAEIVKTHSADFQSTKLKQRRFFTAFHTCFSAHRTRSVAREMFRHIVDYEQRILANTYFCIWSWKRSPDNVCLLNLVFVLWLSKPLLHLIHWLYSLTVFISFHMSSVF